MPVDTPMFFSQVIHEHLELKRRNAELESAMPLNRYKDSDPFDNHPLFKTEEQARFEETMENVDSRSEIQSLSWPTDDAEQPAVELEEALWSRSRDFDWGD